MKRSDTLSPTEQIQEYLDIEKNIRQIAETLENHTSSYPKGIRFGDSEWELTMLCDSQGIYGCLEAGRGPVELKDLDAIIGAAQIHYMARKGAVKRLGKAVQSLGESRTFIVDGDPLVFMLDRNNQVHVWVGRK